MEIKKTNEVTAKGFSMILYSDSGKGKTYALGTLPEKETLIIDIEGGLATIQDKSIDYIPVPHGSKEDPTLPIKKIKEIHEAFITGKLKYKYVAIDSITEMEKYCQFALMRDRFNKGEMKEPFMRIKEYGDVSLKMREYLRWYRDLTHIGINVIFTALAIPIEQEKKDGLLKTKVFPMLSPKLSPEVCGYVDMVARIEMNPENGERRLNLVGDDRHAGKTRLSWLDGHEPVNLKKLFSKAKAGPKAKVEKKTEKPKEQKPEPKKEEKPLAEQVDNKEKK